MEGDSISHKSARTYLTRFIEYSCSTCGISEWNGKEITLQIDHIDGDNCNNNKSNIRWLCPNCHTQTETWGVKNVSPEGRVRMNNGGIKGNRANNKNIPAID